MMDFMAVRMFYALELERELFGYVKAFRVTHAHQGFIVVVSVKQFPHNLCVCCSFSVHIEIHNSLIST